MMFRAPFDNLRGTRPGCGIGFCGVDIHFFRKSKINKTIDDIQKWSGNVRGITKQLEKASEDIVVIAKDVKNTTRNINGFVSTNSLAFGAIVTNIKDTAIAVHKTVGNLEKMIATNKPDITKAIVNIERMKLVNTGSDSTR